MLAEIDDGLELPESEAELAAALAAALFPEGGILILLEAFGDMSTEVDAIAEGVILAEKLEVVGWATEVATGGSGR